MRNTFATRQNADLLDENYERWQRDPQSVDAAWGAFFEGFELGMQRQGNGATEALDAPSLTAGPHPADGAELPLQSRVDGLVYAYRTLGHTVAMLDPLSEARPEQPLLSLRELGFSEKDLELTVWSKFFLGGQRLKLRELIAALERIYAGTIGVEFMHIQNARVRNWVRDRIEGRELELPALTQHDILRVLLQAESFEHFLHTKYVGQKRFSLEGGESLMVILNTLLEQCPARGVKEIVMGMAHRGRLNVLANFLCKSLRSMFTEFSENYVPDLVAGDGDVKYHLGYSTTRHTETGEEIEVLLSANPSHLEAVDPVVAGKARARQRLRGDTEERRQVLPLMIHGDAAFAGQGIVAEVLNLSQLPGYKTGGTVHVIVNNQIGFTTLPEDARSSHYATDVAKMIEAPIFHVNGDDPLAVVFVTKLAFEFRQQFKRDTVIDMYCYRRHGHNEGDEPMFTQPSLYTDIAAHPSTATLFKKRLVEGGLLRAEDAENLEQEFEAKLQATLDEVKRAEQEPAETKQSTFSESTAVFQGKYSHEPADTAISRERMDEIVRALTRTPENFNVLPKIKRMLLDRRAQVHKAGGPYDWSFAEALAFGSLLLEGVPVRLSGQDSRRGTFSQRHSVLYDEETRERYFPLRNITPEQASFCVYNSFLSEAAVLGFDYGYSLEYEEMLCLWEAQFGDFSNGAQVIIDQFIVSAESKWQRPSGIVMLLPHGYEGQGPEHSSGRIERYLQLCAEDNMQVVNCTTPAQYFHVLRRQMRRNFRAPLIVFTPKSLLRAPRAVSKPEEFAEGRFQPVLGDPQAEQTAKKIRRALLCSGKVYYELLEEREKRQADDVAILRVEQLYPWPAESLAAALALYGQLEHAVWVQEEPKNMGGWTFVRELLEESLPDGVAFGYAGRPAYAAPAGGSMRLHRRRQAALIAQAFGEDVPVV